MALGLALYFFDLFPLVIEPWLVASILLGSAGLGVAAGALPAWRASRYEVLDVLRSYEYPLLPAHGRDPAVGLARGLP
jgi:putative ABC transport system permease protein